MLRKRPLPRRVHVPATRPDATNASYQPVEAPSEQDDGAALSTTGTSAESVVPVCQMSSSKPSPKITPALFLQTAKPPTATPADTAEEGFSVALA